jgi:hypothetical protein
MDKTIQTVVVDGMKAVLKEESVSALKGHQWIKCEIPEMIGVPLMVRRCGFQTIRPSNEIAIFLMSDPKSGLANAAWQRQVGIVQFVRSDFTDFSVELFWDVYSYVYNLMDYYGEDNFNYKRFKEKKLISESFKKYQEQEHAIQQQNRR